jgi:Ca2+-binding RTX toxin-like protein
MPKVHISQNQTGQFNADAADTTWIVDKGVTMTSANDFCFASTWQDTRLVLKGTLDHTSMFGSAVMLSEKGGGVTIAASGKVLTTSNGLFLAGDGQHAINRGVVEGARGIVLDGDGSNLDNMGRIVGDTVFGVKVGGAGCELVNATGALIRGVIGIDTLNAMGGTTRIENFGTIRGDDWAVSGGDGIDHIVNRGKIVGSVLLGNGQNVFDTRHGSVTGSVAGGMNGDTYLVGGASVGIFEAAGGGYDTLKTTGSYILDGNNEIEVLAALGHGNVNLAGNGINNRLDGNRGDNVLKGKGGGDWLDGGKGDDVLTGGAGADHFVFKKGGGKDMVTDFDPAGDLVYVENFYLDNGFDDLLGHMKEVHGGLVITMGKDVMTLKGIGFDDITESDFIFANL